MKATIIASVIGVLGFGEDGKMVEKSLFPRDALKIAERLMEIESGRVINEVVVLTSRLRDKGYTTLVFENSELAQAVREQIGVDVEVETPSKIGETLRSDIGRFAVETGFVQTSSEMAKWLHDVSMEMSRTKVRRATEKRDLLIVQAIQALDDLDRTLNLFMNRTREWYGLHFPELDRLLDKNEVYASLVFALGRRDNFTEEKLEREELPKTKALQLSKAARTSMGADLYDTDMQQIQTMCEHALNLYKARSELEKYIDDIMKDIAPNTSALAGATLGARLIALAGGLENLAKRPASTIQVLGAEKALFRSLTSGARPPKHGIIFQHALVHGAQRRLRGKIARAFAGKLAIAVRTDAFSGNYIGEKLGEDLKKRIEEIMKKYEEAEPNEKRTKKAEGNLKPSTKRRKKHGRKG